MHAQTKGAVIEHGMNLAATLAKEMFVRREEEKRLEREYELQKELEEAKAKSQAAHQLSTDDADDDADPVVDNLSKASELAGQYDDLLGRAQEAEECDLCEQLIAAARASDLRTQRQILPQLHDFIRKREQGADRDELKQHLQKSPELLSLIQNTALDQPSGTTADGRERDPPPTTDDIKPSDQATL